MDEVGCRGGRSRRASHLSVAARDDQLLLLDLEYLGYATVTGERDTAVGLLRHIAAELANARWSDDVEILLVGFGPELPPLNTIVCACCPTWPPP